MAGIVVPGGFGERGIEGKIAAARWARENNIPYLGLCLGLQVMIVELAGIAGRQRRAEQHRVRPTHASYPVIDLMAEQRAIADMGGTMRLGLYPCHLVPGTKAAEAYRVPVVHERHRHRFEVNNAYRDVLSDAGLCSAGFRPMGGWWRWRTGRSSLHAGQPVSSGVQIPSALDLIRFSASSSVWL